MRNKWVIAISLKIAVKLIVVMVVVLGLGGCQTSPTPTPHDAPLIQFMDDVPEGFISPLTYEPSKENKAKLYQYLWRVAEEDHGEGSKLAQRQVHQQYNAFMWMVRYADDKTELEYVVEGWKSTGDYVLMRDEYESLKFNNYSEDSIF